MARLSRAMLRLWHLGGGGGPAFCYSGSVAKGNSGEKTRERIDTLLVGRGLSETRHRAQALLLAGEVSVDGRVITRPGTLVGPSAHIEIKERPRFVSRGGD